MKTRWFTTVAMAAALLGGPMIGVTSAGAAPVSSQSASASEPPSSVQACNGNASGLVYYYYTTAGPIAPWGPKICSGYYTLNSDGHRVEPGDWSGYVDFKDGTWTWFCDRTTKYLNRKRVVGIEMSPTKISQCGGLAASGRR